MEWKKLEESILFIVNTLYEHKSKDYSGSDHVKYLSKKCIDICKKQIEFTVDEFFSSTKTEQDKEMEIDDLSISNLDLVRKHLNNIDKTLDSYYKREINLENSLRYTGNEELPPSIIEKLMGKLESIKKYEPDFILNIRDISFDSWKETLDFEKIMNNQRKHYEILINKLDFKWRSRCEFIKHKSALKIIKLEDLSSSLQDQLKKTREHLMVRYEDLYGSFVRKLAQEEEFKSIMKKAGYKDIRALLRGLKGLEAMKNKFQTQVEGFNKEIKVLKAKVLAGNTKNDEYKRKVDKGEEFVKDLESCVISIGEIFSMTIQEKKNFDGLLNEKTYTKIGEFIKALDSDRKNKEEKKRKDEEKERKNKEEERKKKEDEKNKKDDDKRKKDEEKRRKEEEKKKPKPEIKKQEKGKEESVYNEPRLEGKKKHISKQDKTKENSVFKDSLNEEAQENTTKLPKTKESTTEDKPINTEKSQEESRSSASSSQKSDEKIHNPSIPETQSPKSTSTEKITEKSLNSPNPNKEHKNSNLSNNMEKHKQKLLQVPNNDNKEIIKIQRTETDSRYISPKKNIKDALPNSHTVKGELQKIMSSQVKQEPEMIKSQAFLTDKPFASPEMFMNYKNSVHEGQNFTIGRVKRIISPIKEEQEKHNFSLQVSPRLNDSLNSDGNSKNVFAGKENDGKAAKIQSKNGKFATHHRKSLDAPDISEKDSSQQKYQKNKAVYKSHAQHAMVKSLGKMFTNHLLSSLKTSDLPKEGLQALDTLKSMPLEEILSIKLNLNGINKTLQEIAMEKVENCLKTEKCAVVWESVKPKFQEKKSLEKIEKYKSRSLEKIEKASDKILGSNNSIEEKNDEQSIKAKNYENWRNCTLKLFVLIEEYIEILEKHPNKSLVEIINDRIESGIFDDITTYILNTENKDKTIDTISPLISRGRKYELLHVVYNIDSSLPFAELKNERVNVLNKIRWTNIISKIKGKEGKKKNDRENHREMVYQLSADLKGESKVLNVIESNENIIKKNRSNYAIENTALNDLKRYQDRPLNLSSKGLGYFLPQIQKTPRFPERSYNLIPSNVFTSELWVKNSQKSFK